MKLRRYFILIFKKIIKTYFLIRLKNHILFNKKVVIFDIDNTLANTWPSLKLDYKSTNERLKNLNIFQNIFDLIQNYITSDNEIVFLSARNYTTYFVSKQWLKKNGFSKFLLILVESPKEKLFFLKCIKNKKIIFYDDMSYGHESGKIHYYESEITQIKKLHNVEYYGYDFLLKLQNKDINEKI